MPWVVNIIKPDINGNVSRLDQLTDQATKVRLTEKYQRAMDVLILKIFGVRGNDYRKYN